MANWHISENKKTEGPFPEEEIINKIRSGKISKASLVWKRGMMSWEPTVAFQDTETALEMEICNTVTKIDLYRKTRDHVFKQ